MERVRTTPGVRLVICDLSNSSYVDVAGTRILARLYEELRVMQIQLRIVEGHAEQRDILRAEGIDKLVGPINHRESLAATVAEFLGGNPVKTS